MLKSMLPMADKPDLRSLQQAAKEAWLSVLGVVTTAESELHKATARLLETLGLPPESDNMAAELMARMRKNRDEFERRVDEGVRAAVARLRAPIDKEIASLRARLERISARLDQMSKAPRKPKDDK
jgi:hypothetical protein